MVSKREEQDVVIDQQRMEDFEERLRRVERELAVRSAPRSVAAPRPERPVPAERAPRPAPAPRRTASADLEELVGGRVLAWAGGAAVVAGLALLLALGISQGWIGEPARVALAAVVSVALLGAGGWLHERRRRDQAARAAAAAGICGLFMTVTVATSGYHLAPTAAGLALALVTGAVATVLAIRWSSPLVGWLGIAGAVLAPVLVQAPWTSAIVAFEAIAVASAVGVLLRKRWGGLALAVFGLSVPQWLDWLFHARSAAGIVLVLCVFGCLYAAAALGFELRSPGERPRPASAFLLALNGLTLAVAGWFRLKGVGEHDLALAWLVALATAHLGAGLAARRSKRVAAEIGLLCLTLAVLLADVAFALTVDGAPRAAGFAAGGVLLAAIGRRRAGADGLLAELGLGGHIAVSAAQALHEVDASQLLGPGAGAAAVGGLVAVAAGCLVSARLAQEGRPGWRTALDATGLGALGAIALLTLDGPALTAAWAAQAVALARIAAARDDDVARVAAFVHLAAAALFALVDQAAPAGLVDGGTDLAAAALGLGAIAAAAAGVAHALRAPDPAARPLVAACGTALLYLASLVVVALSPEAADGGVVQQGQLQLSALWSVAGVAGLAIGLRRSWQPLRLAALGLLGLAAAKVFLYDLAALTSVYRVCSFLALGLLLLAGAFAYQRMRPPMAG